MAMALRPRASASAISSRYGSQALALGARPGGESGPGSVDTVPVMADFDAPGSVDTSGVMAEYEVAPRSSADLYLAMRQHRVTAETAATRTGSRVASATAGGRVALDAAHSRGHSDPTPCWETSCLNRVFALAAHRLKSVDGSQSVLRGRHALAAIVAITVAGQLSTRNASSGSLKLERDGA